VAILSLDTSVDNCGPISFMTSNLLLMKIID